MRWAWRLFRREWRQQFLVLALITLAVAATITGAAVATNTPPSANFGFGTAQELSYSPSRIFPRQPGSFSSRSIIHTGNLGGMVPTLRKMIWKRRNRFGKP
jgi:hypothetical protein